MQLFDLSWDVPCDKSLWDTTLLLVVKTGSEQWNGEGKALTIFLLIYTSFFFLKLLCSGWAGITSETSVLCLEIGNALTLKITGTIIHTMNSHSKALDDKINLKVPQLCTDTWAGFGYGAWATWLCNAVHKCFLILGTSELQAEAREAHYFVECWWNCGRSSVSAPGRLVFSLQGVQTLQNIKSLLCLSPGNQLPPDLYV